MSVSFESDMKLMILRDHILWSGGTGYLADLLPELRNRGVSFDFCVLAKPDSSRETFENRGIYPRFLAPNGFDPYGLFRFWKFVREKSPDIIHLSGPRAMLIGRVVSGATKLPSTIWFNNALPEPRWRIFLQRRLARLSCANLAVSSATADWASDTYEIPRNKITVQYRTSDLRRFLNESEDSRQAVRSELGLAPSARVIVLSGRVVNDQKGHFGTIKVFPEVVRQVPDAHLLIVGDGPDLASCQRLTSDLGLTDRVTFTGLRRDMPEILHACDIAVVPSLCEDAFSSAAVEASASGLPIVVFGVGGLPEAVKDGETGFVVGKEKWSDFAKALVRILEDQVLAERLSQNGRDFARGFRIEVAAEKFVSFHDELVRKKHFNVSASP